MLRILHKLHAALRGFAESAPTQSCAQIVDWDSPMVVEEMEPRILHSADFAPAYAGGDQLVAQVENQMLEQEAVPAAPAPSTQTEQTGTLELVFVDSTTPDYQMLLDDIASQSADNRFEVVMLDADSDGIQQITDTLATRTDISAIHIISHGSDGVVYLGQSVLDANFIAGNRDQLAGWSASLTEDADILIYGCDVAQSDIGRHLLQRLSTLTGADVAASNDLTGATTLGGDWSLEYSTGTIEADLALTQQAQDEWSGLLVNVTVSTTDDIVDGDTSSLAALQASPGADGFISLREAVIAANTSIAADKIDLPAGTYVLSLTGSGENLANSGDLDITEQLTISGAGADTTIIDGAGADRIFHILSTTAAISGVTVTNGNESDGGGIRVDSASILTLQDVAVSGNTASKTGGGMLVSGTLAVERATFEGNSADVGGGVYVNNLGIASFTNVTMFGNTAASNGGAINTRGITLLTHSTIAGNSAVFNQGGIRIAGSGTAILQNTILANNTGGNSDPVISFGNNIDSANTAGLSGAGDMINTDPLLGPLQYNGGTIKTMALLSGSPAIDGGAVIVGVNDDARGFARDTSPDIGAYEHIAGVSAPVLDPTKTPVLSAINEDAGVPIGAVGTLVSSLVDFASPTGQVDNVTDSDTGALLGIAITGADTTNGSWFYSIDNGTTWNALGAVSDTSALLLSADINTRIYIRPNTNYNGTIANAVTFRAWDQSSGANGTVADTTTNGGSTAFSTATDTASLTVTPVNDAPVGIPTITGTVTEDQALTADTSGISDADGLGAFSYQWLRNGVAISGATASNYALGDADVGTNISVQVSYTDAHGTNEGPLTSAQTAAVANVNDAPVGIPTITGTVTEDQALTADTSGISDADGLGAFSYQWLRNGAAISGATASTYTLGDADVGTNISVQVSYTDAHGTNEGPLTSAQTAAVANVNDAPVGIPTITGTVTEDQALTADTSGISDADGLGAFSHQWLRNGAAISGATASNYMLGDADVGTNINVIVSYTDGYGTAESVASANVGPIANINDAPVGTATTVTALQDSSYIFGASDFGFTDANDNPANNLLAVRISTLPTAGSLTNNGAAVTAGQFVSATDIGAGRLVFTPAAGASGAAYANFTFQVQDDGSGADLDTTARTLTIDVTATTAVVPPSVPPIIIPPEPSDPPPEPEAIEPAPEPAVDPSSEPAPEEGSEPENVATTTVPSGGDADSLGTVLAEAPSNDAPPAIFEVADSHSTHTVRIAAAGVGFDLRYFALDGIDSPSIELNFVAAPGMALPSFEAGIKAIEAPEFFDELDSLRHTLEKQAQSRGTLIASSTAATIGLSVGYVFWLLRAEALLGTFLSSMPAWRLIDPLPILGRLNEVDDEDDESLESMVERRNRTAQVAEIEGIEAI